MGHSESHKYTCDICGALETTVYSSIPYNWDYYWLNSGDKLKCAFNSEGFLVCCRCALPKHGLFKRLFKTVKERLK